MKRNVSTGADSDRLLLPATHAAQPHITVSWELQCRHHNSLPARMHLVSSHTPTSVAGAQAFFSSRGEAGDGCIASD